MSKAPQPAPPSLVDRLRKAVDPAALPILIAGIVLVGAIVWLLARPVPQGPSPAAAVEQRLGAEIASLREQLARAQAPDPRVAALDPRLAALEQRVQSLGDRPAAEAVAPVQQLATGAEERAERAEAAAREAAERAAQNAERLQAAERSVQQLAARPVVDPAALAQRQAVDALAQRVDQAAREAQAQAQQATQQSTQRIEQATREAQAQSQQLGQRVEALAREAAARQAAQEQSAAQAAGRLATLEAANQQRTQDLNALQHRLAALDSALAERTQAANALQQRITALEGAQQRIAALEGRSARLAAIDAARARLEAGRALGDTLAPLRDPPAALARFAGAAPPTEAGLRLSFEEAARAGRTASEPAREGQGVLDSAVARLSGLVTVRRGEEVVWGDAANAELERARRALEAGDLEGTLRHLERLPPRAREAMRDWVAQAEALVAARAALRDLAAG